MWYRLGTRRRRIGERCTKVCMSVLVGYSARVWWRLSRTSATIVLRYRPPHLTWIRRNQVSLGSGRRLSRKRRDTGEVCRLACTYVRLARALLPVCWCRLSAHYVRNTRVCAADLFLWPTFTKTFHLTLASGFERYSPKLFFTRPSNAPAPALCMFTTFGRAEREQFRTLT